MSTNIPTQTIEQTAQNTAATSEQNTKQIRTTCAYCGVGCGVLATVDETTRTVTVAGDPNHPANYGKLCSKGSALGNTLDADRRLAHPTIHGEQVTWDEATAHVANKFSDIIAKHGPDSVMMYVSGQLLTEDYYVANKFTKGFLGTNNIDSNSRLCMSSAVAGYKRAFGSDTVPCSYSDIEDSELFVIIGSNMAWCHPILFGRLKVAKQANPNKKVVVIDPRATDSTQIADLHLPLKSGTDSHFFNGLLNYLHTNGYADDAYLAHCDGIEETIATCAEWTIDNVAKVCGINRDDVLAFYQLFANTKKTVSFYSMGVNQSSSGTDKVNTIINCHLYSGKMGYSGAGAFSITGQPNAMGGREVGALANLLASHLDLANDTHRQQVAEFWNAKQPIPSDHGVKAPNLAEAILSGKVKAVWMMATSPMVSLSEADNFAKALKQCELVVVSDCSKDSETLDYAHVALPAQGWSEKSGTVTNSDRTVSRQRKLLDPYKDAKPDWWIMSQVAQKMGFEGFDYKTEADVFAEHVTLSGYKNNGTRSFDITHLLDATGNITKADYDKITPFQWGKPSYFSTQQLADGENYTQNGKAHLVPVTPQLPKSAACADYPLILNTGRMRDQWHTMTRTGMASQLNQHWPEPILNIHPDDAAKHNLQDRDMVQVQSRHGDILVRAKIDTGQRVGDVFMPIHWNNKFTANGRVGKLIHAHLCPASQQPESKHTPVRISKVPMAGFAKLLMRKDADTAILNWLDKPEENNKVTYWVRNRQQQASDYLMAIPASHASFDEWFTREYWQDVIAGFVGQTVQNNAQNNAQNNSLSFIHYTDANTKSLRMGIMVDDELQAVLFVSPNEANLPNHAWLDSLFEAPLTALNRNWLLAGKPASGFVDVGRIVCSCMSVGENTIVDTITKHGCTNAAQVGKHCKAGTNCGSCISEITDIIKTTEATLDAIPEAS